GGTGQSAGRQDLARTVGPRLRVLSQPARHSVDLRAPRLVRPAPGAAPGEHWAARGSVSHRRALAAGGHREPNRDLHDVELAGHAAPRPLLSVRGRTPERAGPPRAGLGVI